MFISHTESPQAVANKLLMLDNIQKSMMYKHKVLKDMKVKSYFSNDNKFRVTMNKVSIITSDPKSSESKSLYLSLLDSLTPAIFDMIIQQSPENLKHCLYNFNYNNNVYIDKLDCNSVAFLICESEDNMIVYKKASNTNMFDYIVMIEHKSIFDSKYELYKLPQKYIAIAKNM